MPNVRSGVGGSCRAGRSGAVCGRCSKFAPGGPCTAARGPKSGRRHDASAATAGRSIASRAYIAASGARGQPGHAPIPPRWIPGVAPKCARCRDGVGSFALGSGETGYLRKIIDPGWISSEHSPIFHQACDRRRAQPFFCLRSGAKCDWPTNCNSRRQVVLPRQLQCCSLRDR